MRNLGNGIQNYYGTIALTAPAASGIALSVLGTTGSSAFSVTANTTNNMIVWSSTGNATNALGSLYSDTNGNAFFYTAQASTSLNIGGSASGTAIGFTTAGVSRGSVSSAGQWAMSAPGAGVATLLVAVNASTTNTAQQWSSSSATLNGAGALQFDTNGNLYFTNSTANTGFTIGNYAATSTLAFVTSGVTRMTFSAIGAVTVAAPSSGATLLLSTVAGQNGVQISGGAAAQLNAMTFAQSGQNAWTIYQPASSNDFRLFNGASDRFIVSGNGNVSIPAPASGVALTVNSFAGTHSTQIADSANALFNAGYLAVPPNAQTVNYTAVLADSGKSIDMNGTSLTATIPANASVAYPVGTVLTFTNINASALSIAITTDTLTAAGTTSTGTRTLSQNGIATARKQTATTWLISGPGLS